MKIQILVLQGAGEGAHEWDMSLIHALKAQLGDDYQIHFPKMPNEKSPSYLSWAGKIDQELEKLPDPVIVLGHSLGGSVFLKYISACRTNRKFPALFLLSSPFWGEPEWEVDEFQLSPGFEERLDSIGQILIYHSKDDPFVPFEHSEVYKKHLPSAIIRSFENAGHEMVSAVPVLVTDIEKVISK